MKILALIPARSDSKRIPNKNIRHLGKKPLLVWSIDIAKGIPEICDILVSTNDTCAAEIARSVGGLVPWLRPVELATDTATMVEVSLHALNWYSNAADDVDGLLVLQPTSPFRKKESILQGIKLFRQYNHRTVVGVSPARVHPQWCFRLEGENMKPFWPDNNAFCNRSQDLTPAFCLNGAFYLIAPDILRNTKSFYSNDPVALVMDSLEESLDIDDEDDWRFAEMLYAWQKEDIK